MSFGINLVNWSIGNEDKIRFVELDCAETLNWEIIGTFTHSLEVGGL